MSCYEDDSCNQNTNTGVNITVANMLPDSVDTDSLNSSHIESWRFKTLEDTTIFISSDNLDYTTGIPLNMNDTVIKLLFQIRDNDTTDYLVDTIILGYIQTDLELLSANCGFAPVFKITNGSFTMHVLDSVAIENSKVSTDLQLNNVAFFY